jgi:hypothetical protein
LTSHTTPCFPMILLGIIVVVVVVVVVVIGLWAVKFACK